MVMWATEGAGKLVKAALTTGNCGASRARVARFLRQAFRRRMAQFESGDMDPPLVCHVDRNQTTPVSEVHAWRQNAGGSGASQAFLGAYKSSFNGLGTYPRMCSSDSSPYPPFKTHFEAFLSSCPTEKGKATRTQRCTHGGGSFVKFSQENP